MTTPRSRSAASAVCGFAASCLALAIGLAVTRAPLLSAGQQPGYGDYGYGNRPLTPEQREGRDTWYFWTGGDQQFWVEMARITEGNVSLLNYVDGRRHGRRFRELGAITQPGCEAATAPDQYGLWMDRCDQPAVPGVPGEPSGIVGLRKFPNPKFDPANWDAAKYIQHPGTMQPPYLIGMTCGFCHIGFNPLNPPTDPERPTLGQPGRHDRQSVLGGREAVQPEHEAGRLPLARRRPPAAGHIRYLAVCHRSHQQSQRHQHDLQPRVASDRAGADARRHDARGAPHPQGRCGFGRRGRRLASCLREHRHVRRLLGDAATIRCSGSRDSRSHSTWTTRARTAPTGCRPKRAWPTPKPSSRP